MQPINDLVLKYFKRECTPEEAEQVHEYFTANTDVLNKYLGEQEWTNLTQYKNPEEEKSKIMLNAVLKQIDHEPAVKKLVFNRWFVGGVAACVCLVLTLIFTINLKQQSLAVKPYAVNKKAVINWQNTVNTGHKVLQIILDDGSRIALAPNAAIKYALPFKAKLRDVYLQGQAKFYVAKDKARPFTVYAGPLATTALGTVFKITAWPKGSFTRVRLISGKVKVVQHQHPNPQVVYLLPGKELVFNHGSQSLIVSSFNTQPLAPVWPVIAGSTTVKGDTVNFDNQQLPLVMNKLRDYYHVRIESKVNLKKYYFTGEFNTRTDPISNVLSTITSLNKLHYTITPDSTYILSKRP
jgi:transmembrane sensor